MNPEENREPFRAANGVVRLIPFLQHKDEKVVLTATEALLNLSFAGIVESWSPRMGDFLHFLDSNQPTITKGGALPYLMKNSTMADFQLKYESLYLIRNLVRCSKYW